MKNKETHNNTHSIIPSLNIRQDHAYISSKKTNLYQSNASYYPKMINFLYAGIMLILSVFWGDIRAKAIKVPMTTGK